VDGKKVRVRVRVKKSKADSILIASRQRLVGEAIGNALEAEGMDVVAIASTGAEALAHAACSDFATALIDLDLPDAKGVDVGSALLQRDPKIHLIAMSDPPDLWCVTEALEAGFGGYLSGGMDVHRLLLEIDRSTARKNRRARASRRKDEEPDEGALGPGDPTPALDEGATAAELGRRLDLGDGTVLGRVMDVLSKLQDEESDPEPRPGRSVPGGNHYPGHLRRKRG
jgi:DNA-binding NarL/FixJ family response regulator